MSVSTVSGWRPLGTSLAILALAGCAGTTGRPPEVQALLQDPHFQAVHLPVQADQVLAMSPDMRRFADQTLMRPGRHGDPQRRLIDALYRPRDDAAPASLSLHYQAEATRTAAQTFETRAGNCLSLVLMTAAFARHLGVPMRFQQVSVEPSYTRSGDLLLAAGHINLALGRPMAMLIGRPATEWTTVDFLPQADLKRQRFQVVPTSTVLAMYMNNRAADALVAGRVDESYAWVREALRQDPGFSGGVNTLAVVYMRRGLVAQAEQVLRHVLERAPSDQTALSNLVALLERGGRLAEAQAAMRQLMALQGPPPFHFHDLGHAALARGDASQARDLFQRELQRQPGQHESHHGLAAAYAALGDTRRAAEHLNLALEYGGSAEHRQRYAAKLAWLRDQASRVH